VPVKSRYAKVFQGMTCPGIYVQVPFCQTKCTYCNFPTGVVAAARFAPYARALCQEIAHYRSLCESAGVRLPELLDRSAVDTVYIGGGTPSLLDPRLLQEILDAIRAHFNNELAEVTLEADPETLDAPKVAGWLRAGINRVSLGVQSFSDRELVACGRQHRAQDVHRAVVILREAGIHNISFDLIAGLAYQTLESWRASLDELALLAPEHVSVYLLEVDDSSHLGKELRRGGQRYGARAVPSEDQMAECYETACDVLSQLDYSHYEISNWAKPGFSSRHNMKYWRREPYLGFGAGAHSFSGAERWANVHDPACYVQAIEAGSVCIEQREAVTPESALEEELFLGLRQLQGIDLRRIESQYGVDLAKRFEPLAAVGLVERIGSLVRLAPARLSVSNEVFVALLR